MPEPIDVDFTSFPPLPAVTEAQTRTLTPEVEVGSSRLKGTGFFVTLSGRNVNAPVTSRKPLILIIDDEPTVCELLETYLQGEGYATRSACNLEDIKRQVSRLPLPDLILCDVEMPDANGFDLLNKFRNSEMFGKVPVVMLTGRNEKQDILRGLSLGAAGYITKPAKLGVVQNAVQKLLRYVR